MNPHQIQQVIVSKAAHRELSPDQIISALKTHQPEMGPTRCVLETGQSLIVYTDPEDGVTRIHFLPFSSHSF